MPPECHPDRYTRNQPATSGPVDIPYFSILCTRAFSYDHPFRPVCPPFPPPREGSQTLELMDPTTPTPSDRPRQSDHLKEFVIAAAREGWPGYTDAELYHDPAYYKEIYSIPNMLPPKHDEVGGIQVHWHQDTFGCQVTDHIDAELGDIVVGRSKRYIQLARNKFSTRYMIMRRMEYFLEQLEEAPDGKKLDRLFCSCH